MTSAGRDRAVFAAALVLGAGGAVLGGPARPLWYLPWSALLLFVFGYVASRSAWRWPLLHFGSALAAVLVIGRMRGADPGTLGVLGFTLLEAVGLLPVYLGVSLRRLRQRRRAARFAANLRRAELESRGL